MGAVSCVGISLDALENGKIPVGIWLVSFMRWKLFTLLEARKRKAPKRRNHLFFYGKTTTFGWDPDYWRWVDGYHFLNYIPPSLAKTLSSTRSRESLMQWRNGKAISWATMLGGTICILPRIGRGKVGSLIDSLVVLMMAWGLSLASGVGGPWLGGSSGLSVVGGFVGAVTFYMVVFHVQGTLPPLDVGAFSWFLIYLAQAMLAFLSQKRRKDLCSIAAGFRWCHVSPLTWLNIS